MSSSQHDPAEPVEVVKLRELTDTERGVLELERTWFKYSGSKEEVIRERFGISATRYYQLLRALLEREEALAFDPLLVKRLRNLRDSRARSRSRRRFD